jgi:8-oxo-dGTP diphosphatase
MDEAIERRDNFELVLDRYDGITLQENFDFENALLFETALNNIIEYCTIKQRKLLWIYVPIEKAHLIASCTQRGFEFHTCESHRLLLVKKLLENPIVPTAANHTLGVGVVVINDNDEVLVIQEKHSTIGFKLPGGHIDDGELIQNAVKREVFEETGVNVVFESIISLGHFYPHQFNKSNLYVLCKAKALSHTINIQDTQEIVDAKWVNVQEYLNDESIFEYSKEIVRAALHFEGIHNKDLESFRKIPRNYELFFPKQ